MTYGQRTADNRLVFGARGYRFGGKLRENFQLDDDEIALRRYLFGELFPMLRNVRLTHSWGGNLGMARRFQPHMLVDRASASPSPAATAAKAWGRPTSAVAPWPT